MPAGRPDEGGDPACWLDRVCDACGAVLGEVDDRCPVCGEEGPGT